MPATKNWARSEKTTRKEKHVRPAVGLTPSVPEVKPLVLREPVDFRIAPVIRWGLASVLFFFTGLLFACRYSELQYIVWQHEGFYFEWRTITESLRYIGEPLARLTSFLLQSFAFPVCGGLMVAAIVTLLTLLASGRVARNAWGFLYAAMIPLFLIIVLTRQGYYLFGFRSFAFFFQMLVGLCLAFAAAAGYARLRLSVTRICFAVLTVGLLYPVLGTFVLCTGLYIIKTEIDERFSDVEPNNGQDNKPKERDSLSEGKNIRLILAILLTAVTPLFWYIFYSGTIPLCMIYAHNYFYREITLVDLATIAMNRTFCIVVVVLILLPLLGTIFSVVKKIVRPESIGLLSLSERPKLFSAGTFCSILIFPLLVVGTLFGARHDENFLTALAVGRLFDEEKWDDIIALESRLDHTILPLIELRRHAQLEKGILVDHYFDHCCDYYISPDLVSVTSFRIYGIELQLLNGNVNHGYRQAINDFQFRRNESPRLIRHLFFGALINGEHQLAERYLLRLEKTPFRSGWCREMRRVLDACRWTDVKSSNGEVLVPEEDNAIKSTEDPLIRKYLDRFRLIRCLRSTTDYLGGDDIHYLPSVSYASRFREMKGIPRPYQEQQLFHQIIIRDFIGFRTKLALYWEERKKEGITKLPTLLEEGILYCHFRDVNRIEQPPGFPCSVETLDRFIDYVQLMRRIHDFKDTAALATLRSRYSETCWFSIDMGEEFLFY